MRKLWMILPIDGRGTTLAATMTICAVMVVTAACSRKPAAPPIAQATPRPIPATPPPATPEPVVVKATPMPVPVVAATPVPARPAATPPPLDLATVARTPALVPAQIALVRPVAFPVILGGRAAGEVQAPAGAVVRVLRITGMLVEVQYQNAKKAVPVSSTDLMARALALHRSASATAPRSALAPPSDAPAPASARASQPSAAPTPVAMAPALASKRIAERISVDVVRMRQSRVEGGDFDDKKDRIKLKVTLANADTAATVDRFKGEIYVLGESILDRSALKLLGAQSFEFTLPPRASKETITDEVTTAFDTTGARFGFRYDGWVVRLLDSTGAVALVKSSSPSLAKSAENISGFKVGQCYDRTTFKQRDRMR